MAPSSSRIKEVFEPLAIQGQQGKFFEHVADNVHWTIPGHSPMSKTYANKDEFFKATLQYLREKVLTEPLRLRVVNVVGGGDSNWAAVELTAIDARCKNGLTYDMDYCWIIEFDENETITRTRILDMVRLLYRSFKYCFGDVYAVYQAKNLLFGTENVGIAREVTCVLDY